jgi:hypothetical protein
MSNETKNDQQNLPVVTIDDDGFNDDQIDNGLIKGGIARCVDGLWSLRDETPLPKTLIGLSCTEALQRWEAKLPAETIVRRGGQPLPDVDTLNARIPKKKWEQGLDGKPRPPWQLQHVVYLLDPRDASVITYLNSTAGAKIAVRELKDRVAMMRKLRGSNVVPIVELSSKIMRTQFGQKAAAVLPYRRLA